MQSLPASVELLSNGITKVDNALTQSIAYDQQVLAGLEQLLGNYEEGSAEYTNISNMIEAVNGSIQYQQGAQSGLGDVSTGCRHNGNRGKQLVDGVTQIYNGLNDKKKGLVAGVDNLNTGLKTVNEGASALKTGIGTLAKSSKDLNNGAATLSAGTKNLSAGVNSAQAGASKLDKGVDSLNSGVSKLSNGAKTLDSGLGQLDNGSKQLKDGTATLYSSLVELAQGTTTLSSGSAELFSGIGQLKDGSSQLSSGVKKLERRCQKTLKDGMAKYKDEGIGKLLDIYNNDLKGLIDRLDALKKAAEDSTTFSGAADGVESSVKYIYETAAIEKADE